MLPIDRDAYLRYSFELKPAEIELRASFLDWLPDEITDCQEMKLESIRVLNSLVYQARKLLINRQLIDEERVQMMKFCIYASIYALAAEKQFPKNKIEAMEKFKAKFKELQDPLYFLHLKVNKTSKISDEDVFKAYDFLQGLDKLIYSRYKFFFGGE